MNREQIVSLELREKAFGGGDARLGAASRVQLRVGLARDRRVHRVRNRQQMSPARAPFFHRGDRVGGLARLRHRDDHRAIVDRRPPIAELGRVIDLDRNRGEMLDHELAHLRGDPRRARTEHHDSPDRRGTARRQQLTLEAHGGRRAVRPPGHRVDPRLRLIVDFLAQVMAKATLRRSNRVPFNLTWRASDCGAVELHQPNCGGGDLGQLAVLEDHRAARVFENRGNVRRDKILAVAQPQHHRRRSLGGDQLAGFGLRQHDY